MKKIQTAAMTMLLLLTACSEDAVISSTIEGKWKGTLAELEVRPFGLPIPIKRDDTSFATEIEFRPDGSMAVHENSRTTEGTYAVAGEKLTTDIDYKVEGMSLAGTYTIETLTDVALKFNLTKRDTTIADPDGGASINGRVKITLHFRRL